VVDAVKDAAGAVAERVGGGDEAEASAETPAADADETPAAESREGAAADETPAAPAEGDEPQA
ncbi:MAG TPA: hypothetical protein VHG91_11125, partial [Longimicrobium sp.]|nr:hypothetical protein [Longimicrobium sp.]